MQIRLLMAARVMTKLIAFPRAFRQGGASMLHRSIAPALRGFIQI